MLGGVASATNEIDARLDVLEGFMSRMNDHVVEVSNEAGGGLQFLTQVEFKEDLLLSGNVTFAGSDSDVLTVIQGIVGRLDALESTKYMLTVEEAESVADAANAALVEAQSAYVDAITAYHVAVASKTAVDDAATAMVEARDTVKASTIAAANAANALAAAKAGCQGQD